MIAQESTPNGVLAKHFNLIWTNVVHSKFDLAITPDQLLLTAIKFQRLLMFASGVVGIVHLAPDAFHQAGQLSDQMHDILSLLGHSNQSPMPESGHHMLAAQPIHTPMPTPTLHPAVEQTWLAKTPVAGAGTLGGNSDSLVLPDGLIYSGQCSTEGTIVHQTGLQNTFTAVAKYYGINPHQLMDANPGIANSIDQELPECICLNIPHSNPQGVLEANGFYTDNYCPAPITIAVTGEIVQKPEATPTPVVSPTSTLPDVIPTPAAIGTMVPNQESPFAYLTRDVDLNEPTYYLPIHAYLNGSEEGVNQAVSFYGLIGGQRDLPLHNAFSALLNEAAITTTVNDGTIRNLNELHEFAVNCFKSDQDGLSVTANDPTCIAEVLNTPLLQDGAEITLRQLYVRLLDEAKIRVDEYIDYCATAVNPGSVCRKEAETGSLPYIIAGGIFTSVVAGLFNKKTGFISKRLAPVKAKISERTAPLVDRLRQSLADDKILEHGDVRLGKLGMMLGPRIRGLGKFLKSLLP